MRCGVIDVEVTSRLKQHRVRIENFYIDPNDVNEKFVIHMRDRGQRVRVELSQKGLQQVFLIYLLRLGEDEKLTSRVANGLIKAGAALLNRQNKRLARPRR